jgi:predicted membrane chloride channel (bestrophin family)
MFDTQKAAEVIKESRFSYDNEITIDSIANVIQRHLENLVDEALSDPEEFFKNNYKFWRDINKSN